MQIGTLYFALNIQLGFWHWAPRKGVIPSLRCECVKKGSTIESHWFELQYQCFDAIFGLVQCYREDAGNAIEENSNVFSLVQMH